MCHSCVSRNPGLLFDGIVDQLLADRVSFLRKQESRTPLCLLQYSWFASGNQGNMDFSFLDSRFRGNDTRDA